MSGELPSEQRGADSNPGVDEVCQLFAAAWKARTSPALQDFLSRVAAEEQSRAFPQLLGIDLWWRRVRGEPISASELVAQYPQRARQIQDVVSALPTGDAVALDVVSGPHAGEAFEFTEHQTLLIGRSSSSQMVLNHDLHLSRHHCRLEIRPPLVRIVDLESRNGTLVNDVKVRECDLQHGDRVRFGRSECIVRILTPLDLSFPELVPTTLSHAPQLQLRAPSDFGDHEQLEVPGYELLETLGRGGLGVVYRVRQLATGKDFAAKFILPAQATDLEATRLFLREATVLSQLQHPRIVQFHELGLSGSLLYLVMEYVPTISWWELVGDKSISRRIKVACGVICRVLDALEFAHERGFVHRDVKPPNILLSMVAGRLQVKLADFGLAKSYLTAGMSGLTQEGVGRGSMSYMPPEQVVDCRMAKPAADLYAVGVTLFYFLTGKLPFEFANQGSALRMILEDPPLRADKILPEIPTTLADAIDQALSKDAADRFPNASAMRTALAPFAQS